MTGQDQMNIVRKVTVQYGIENCDIADEIEKLLKKKEINYDMELLEELTDDIKFRYDHECSILEMDRQSEARKQL